MNLKENFVKYTSFVFSIMAIGLIFYVIFYYPSPGVADQGDFYRVIKVSGLELTEEFKNSTDFDRFFHYIIPEYKISDITELKLSEAIASSSISSLIIFVSSICKFLGDDIFKTIYLAIIYSIIYIFSLYIIVRYLNVKSKATFLLFTILSLFVFLDGNYLLWFNSLYGEPLMITTLLLHIASWIYYYHHKNVLKSDNKLFFNILLIMFTSFLFLGSKLQVISSLPIIFILLFKLLWENKNLLGRFKLIPLAFLSLVVLIYPIEISKNSNSLSDDTHYNSVFSGVLKDSKDSKKDLKELGLNPDMSVEAGKDSYLPIEQYEKYIPGSELTREEFYSKISNGKLVKFYISHPLRLIKGMEYTSEHAFFTGTFLGKFEKKYSIEPIIEFNRFTLWSDFRAKVLPENLFFIILVYIIVFTLSIYTYIKNKEAKEIKDKIQLFLSLQLIGILQFPMPFMGNGQSDTSKQLFLFNFIFDILIVISLCWCFNYLIKFINLKLKK
ncbi:MAG: hypothetical protein AB6733_14235 [Clostridiaceae bacterium]